MKKVKREDLRKDLVPSLFNEDLIFVWIWIYNASLLVDYDSPNDKYFLKENILEQQYEIGINNNAKEKEKKNVVQKFGQTNLSKNNENNSNTNDRGILLKTDKTNNTSKNTRENCNKDTIAAIIVTASVTNDTSKASSKIYSTKTMI